MFGKKKTNVSILSSIDFEYTDREIIISKNPENYENNYLWEFLLHDILLELTDHAQVSVKFFDDQMYNVFIQLIDNHMIKAKNDDIRLIMIDSCQRRMIAELMEGYSFFDYSDIFNIIIYDNTDQKRCCISPAGDGLGLKISQFNDFSYIEAIVKAICSAYNIQTNRKNMRKI